MIFSDRQLFGTPFILILLRLLFVSRHSTINSVQFSSWLFSWLTDDSYLSSSPLWYQESLKISRGATLVELQANLSRQNRSPGLCFGSWRSLFSTLRRSSASDLSTCSCFTRDPSAYFMLSTLPFPRYIVAISFSSILLTVSWLSVILSFLFSFSLSYSKLQLVVISCRIPSYTPSDGTCSGLPNHATLFCLPNYGTSALLITIFSCSSKTGDQ